MGSVADGRTAPYLTAGRRSGPDESRRTGWELEVGVTVARRTDGSSLTAAYE